MLINTKIQIYLILIISIYAKFIVNHPINSHKKQSNEEIYQSAYDISSKIDANNIDWRNAGTLYLKAAGLKYEELRHPSAIPSNITIHRGILRELAKCLEYGYGVPKNEKLSYGFFKRASELGDPEALSEMAVRYSYGMTDDDSYNTGKFKYFSKGDEMMALLHYTFGAQANDTFSQMALGYRHMIGLGVPRNCPTASTYYNTVAEKVIELSQKQGTLPYIEKVRLSTRSHHSYKRAREEQWFQYYQYSADMGDTEAQTVVGQIYNFGAHGIDRDHVRSLHYFELAAEGGDGNAMAHLGHMYANGIGVEKNNRTALDWFNRAVDKKSPNGYYGLGYMYLTGYGIQKNYKLAYQYLSKASEHSHAEAQFHLGVMHLKGYGTRTSPMKAVAFFTAASHGGHLLAMYNLAMMHLSGTGIEPSCMSALKLLKQIAEKGPWSSVLQKGHELFRDGNYYMALLSYLRSSQLGLEYGQSNAAWMLEHGYAPGNSTQNTMIALGLYKRSAEQENILSLLSIGDIFYYGRGTEKDWKQSASIYQQAEKYRSSRAAFNLGFMYQFGAGLPKDLHLARRYYDLAKEHNSDAYYVSQLSLLFLSFQSYCENHLPYLSQTLLAPIFTPKYLYRASVPNGWWSGRRSQPYSDDFSIFKEVPFFDRIMSSIDFEFINDALQDLVDSLKGGDVPDTLETAILGILMIIFVLLFARHHRNRRRRVVNRDVPIGNENNIFNENINNNEVNPGQNNNQ